MPNVEGQSYAFAAMTPIISGGTQGVIHVAALRSVLTRLTELVPSPFTRVPGTHFFRWNVIDGMPQLGYPTEEDHLRSKYLLLETDFDGPRDAWIDALATVIPETVTAVYRHCVGFPGVSDLRAFRKYLVACQLDTTLDFAPYASEPLDGVLRALDTQRRFVAFVQEAQGRSDQELRMAFTHFAKQLSEMPPPAPGNL